MVGEVVVGGGSHDSQDPPTPPTPPTHGLLFDSVQDNKDISHISQAWPRGSVGIRLLEKEFKLKQ